MPLPQLEQCATGLPERLASPRCDLEIPPGSPPALRARITHSRREISLLHETLERHVRGAAREPPTYTFEQLVADRHAVGFVPLTQHNQEYQVLQLAQIGGLVHRSIV